jgi:hypothetical protein
VGFSLGHRANARNARRNYPDLPTGAAWAAIFGSPRIGTPKLIGRNRPPRRFGGVSLASSAGGQRAFGHGAGAKRGQSTRNSGAKPATQLDGNSREFAKTRVVREYGKFSSESIQRSGCGTSA